jgi:ribulose-5-phosphate 4-epimerase/fuculose-1-phosphate aldolase
MTDLIYNHITARIPGDDELLLINGYGYLYDEITASNLVTIDIEGRVVDNPNPPEIVVNAAG